MTKYKITLYNKDLKKITLNYCLNIENKRLNYVISINDNKIKKNSLKRLINDLNLLAFRMNTKDIKKKTIKTPLNVISIKRSV